MLDTETHVSTHAWTPSGQEWGEWGVAIGLLIQSVQQWEALTVLKIFVDSEVCAGARTVSQLTQGYTLAEKSPQITTNRLIKTQNLSLTA